MKYQQPITLLRTMGKSMPFDRAAFLQGYFKLIDAIWNQPNYFDLVCRAPRQELARHGIGIADDAQIELIILRDPRDGKVEDQVDFWEIGTQTNYYRLMIARPLHLLEDDPLLDLNDDELDQVEGGASIWAVANTWRGS